MNNTYKTKNCQNCKKDFIIDSRDSLFYEKIQVPPPTFCPDCRLERRLTYANFSKFYKRSCDSCGKITICIHPEDRSYKMYCNPCWWKDNWDGTEYGMDYDHSKYFFDQLLELKNKSIFMALETLTPSNVNTEYTNNAAYQKDSFMTVFADYSEHCAYTGLTAHIKDCLDCYRAKDSELCYECAGVDNCYNCKWSEELENCVTCSFCRSCYGCVDCFGCVNLRNKTDCIFNVQYTKEEYKKKMKEFAIDKYEEQQKALNQAKKLWKKAPNRSYYGNSLNVNVSGDYIKESKNTHNAYWVTGAEDCRYVQYLNLKSTKDCYDYTGWGNSAELLYECYIVGEGAYNNKFSGECWPNAQNTEYSFYCIQSKDCFGCVNLKRKQYCILNKQYTKEEYFKLKEKIITEMKANPWKSKVGHIYSYGEFLPPELSPFGYNETIAFEYNPISKDEAEKAGYNWYDIPKKDYNITLQSPLLPSSLAETTDQIKKEVIQCSTCDKGYNISDIEFELLSKFNQPIPHSCPNCRHIRRFDRTNKTKLYDRQCDKCNVDIKTSYSPERKEIIYCESCYRDEVI